MTLLATLTQAAFWHQPICPSCHEVGEEGERGECPECGEGPLVQAQVLLAFVQGVRDEDEDEL